MSCTMLARPGSAFTASAPTRHSPPTIAFPILTRPRDGLIASDDLKADLVDHLGDRGVHLPRHDRRSRLYGWKRNLRETRAWSHAEQPQVARDLPELDRQAPHGARVRDHVSHA